MESIKGSSNIAAHLFVSPQLKGISMETSCSLLWELASRTRLHCACISTLILWDYFLSASVIGGTIPSGATNYSCWMRGRPLRVITYHAFALHITYEPGKQWCCIVYWRTWHIAYSSVSFETAHVLKFIWANRIKIVLNLLTCCVWINSHSKSWLISCLQKRAQYFKVPMKSKLMFFFFGF